LQMVEPAPVAYAQPNAPSYQPNAPSYQPNVQVMLRESDGQPRQLKTTNVAKYTLHSQVQYMPDPSLNFWFVVGIQADNGGNFGPGVVTFAPTLATQSLAPSPAPVSAPSPAHAPSPSLLGDGEVYPVTDAERASCVSEWTEWTSSSDVSLKTSAAPHIKRTRHVTSDKIDFRVLQAATDNFSARLEIGAGGSCSVFRAKVYGYPCAVKVRFSAPPCTTHTLIRISSFTSPSPSTVSPHLLLRQVLNRDASWWDEKQFANEVRLLTRVRHPNICQLYACSIGNAQQCLVLELMSGALDDRLVAAPPLGWRQRLLIALHVCRSLVHLHSLSPPMIHRDIKCQNGKGVGAWRLVLVDWCLQRGPLAPTRCASTLILLRSCFSRPSLLALLSSCFARASLALASCSPSQRLHDRSSRRRIRGQGG
jgi:hypothetical protein